MFDNILKFTLGLSLLALIQAELEPQVTFSTSSDNPSYEFNYPPLVRLYNNKLYYFAEDTLTWFEAFLSCRYLGGFLVSIESPDIFYDLSIYMADRNPYGKWWTSGSNLASYYYDIYYWYGTGEIIDFLQNRNVVHDPQCVILDIEGEYFLNSLDCKQSLNYVCEFNV